MEKSSQDELKELAAINIISGIIPEETAKKIIGFIHKLAVPAFEKMKSHLGNDEFRYIIYNDRDFGIVIHKIKTETSEISFEPPKEGDITIITEDKLKDIDSFVSMFI